MALPSITSNQIAIDPISGVFYFKDDSGSLVSSSLNLLQNSNTQITTEDSVQVSGDLVVSGNLTVNGTTITVSTESIVVEDKNIELGYGITTDAGANGGGITLKGATDKTFNWVNTTSSWTSSEDINLLSGKVFRINGTEVLSANVYTGSAAKWTNARVITLDGDLSGNVSIDGSANVTLTATIVANSVALGTDTTGNYVASLVAGTGISLANNSGEGTTPTITLNASIDELTDVVISNAANGDFFRYNGSTWVNDAINLSTDTIGDYVDHLVAGTGITITNNSGEATTPTIAIGQSVATNANVSFNQVNAEIVGNVTGNLSGNVTGNLSGNVTGNLSGNSNGVHTGNVTGTASNALVWTNQRKITLDGDVTGNVFIDGSANVTITTTIASNSVALGTDTTGDYVANLVSGTGITITDNSGEGMTPVIKVADSYTTNMVSNISNSAASVSAYADTVGNTAYSNAVTYVNNRTLDDLSGVTISNAATNNVLLYNGSAWVNSGFNTAKLSDVSTNNVLNGQVLLWDSDLGKWVNSIIPEAPAGTSLSFTKGNNTDTDFTMFHGLGTADVVVTVRSNITYEVIETRWSTTDSVGAYSEDHVTVNFTNPPNENEMQITIYGSIQSTGVVITGRLDNLSGDVMIGSPSSGDGLSYNGSKWVNRKANITTDMGDVVISGNATGQFLKFDGNTWINSSIPTINNLDDVGDVNVSSKSTDDLLKWNGSAWVAVTPTKSIVGLANVDNTTDLNKPISNAAQTALDLKANSNSSPTITLGGDLTGNVTLSNLGNATLTATIAANSVALGTDTTGDFVSSLVAGTGILLSNNSGENSTPTVSVDTSTMATKAYVDNTASGIIARPSVYAASTNNLVGTYTNGTLGVGATFTYNTNGDMNAITAFGVTGWTVGKGVLLKNQTNKAHNGRYFVSDLGSVSTGFILTRCGYCDEASEIPGSYTFVQYGNSAGTGWIQIVADPETFTVGTDDINVYQFSGSGTYTAGSGLSFNENEINIGTASNSRIIINANDIDLATVSVSTSVNYDNTSNNFITSITVDEYGRVTAKETHGYVKATSNVAGVIQFDSLIFEDSDANFSIKAGAIKDSLINTSANIALSKLASGTSAQVILANSSGVPTYTTVSGDVTISNSGVTAIGSGVVTSTMIENNTIVNADINSSAAIDYSKLSLSNSITVTDLQAGAPRAGFNSTLRTVTSSNTLVSTDLAKLIVANSSSDMNITISTSATFNDGDRIDLLRAGTGEVTVLGSGITIVGTPGYRLRAQWSSATLIRLNSTTWVAVGDLKV